MYCRAAGRKDDLAALPRPDSKREKSPARPNDVAIWVQSNEMDIVCAATLNARFCAKCAARAISELVSFDSELAKLVPPNYESSEILSNRLLIAFGGEQIEFAVLRPGGGDDLVDLGKLRSGRGGRILYRGAVADE